jgi:hypothetical protein
MVKGRRRGAGRSALFGVLVVVLTAVAASAGAQTKEECGDAFDAVDPLRHAGRLREAMASASRCQSDACPAFIRSECVKAWEELRASVPTVILRARGERGGEAAVIRAAVDDHPLSLDGRAIEIDPGNHTFTVELADGQRVARDVQVSEGVKNQVVDLIAPEAPIPTAEPVSHPTRPVPLAAWVVAGVAVVAYGAFGVLGVAELNKESDLRSTCGHECSTADVSALRAAQLRADIALSIGFAATAGAAVLYLARPTVMRTVATPAGLGIGIARSAGACAGVLAGRF